MTKFYVSKKFFKENNEGKGVSAKDLTDSLCQFFEPIFENTEMRPEDALFRSMEVISIFYLRIFSEMQTFPDFMNTEIDGASEWREKQPNSMRKKVFDSENVPNTYKKEISKAISFLIQKGNVITEKDTCKILNTYFENSRRNVDKAVKKASRPKFSILGSIKQICLLNVTKTLDKAKQHFLTSDNK